MSPEFYALLGTAASAAIAALGYLWKNWYERRRTTRTVLYHLLEIHHRVARFHFGMKHYPQEHIDRCTEVLKQRGFQLDVATLETLRLMISDSVRNLALAEIRELKLRLVEPFDKALTDLAKDDPLLAFELRGKDDIASIGDKLEKAMPGLLSTEEVSVDLATQLAKLREPIEDFERTASLDALDRCIRMTASSCGIFTRFKVHRHLKAARNVEVLDDIEPGFGRKAEELFERFVDSGLISKKRPEESTKTG